MGLVMGVHAINETKSGQMDILDRVDFSTLSHQDVVECIAKVKAEYERLNNLKSSSFEHMNHKLKVLKL